MWRLLAAAVLLAFSFQAYLAQTHIHEIPAATVAVATLHNSGHGKLPADNSPFDCPFCQLVTHAGSFLLSDVPFLFLAPQWVAAAPPRHLAVATGMAAHHDWRSRAPPSH